MHGDSSALASLLDQKLEAGRSVDLLYIDGRHDEAGAYGDYSNLSRHLRDDSVLVFDDCDPRFPGVEQAVNRIAAERKSSVRLISFWPAQYMVAVLSSKVPLSGLCESANSGR